MYNVAAAALLIVALAAIVYQSNINHGHYKAAKRAVKESYKHDEFPHPILIWRTKFHTLYAKGIREIEKSPHRKFWLVSQDLDVMMMMNYFVYPKELRVNLETQIELEKRHYAEDYRPFTQLPPEGEYEETIFTHFRETTFD